MKTLTSRQQQILDFIDQCQTSTGETPTLREIAAHFGFRSLNAARDHIRALCKKGVLQQRPGKARALQLVNPLREQRSQVVDIPIFGSIPAGYAEGQTENAEGCVSIDVNSLGIRKTARTFALRVRGDSMIGRHICDGDIVVCEHGTEPKNGDVVAALIDNESTLKTYVKKGRKVYLKAENPNYPELLPINELVVQGTVVSAIRNFK